MNIKRNIIFALESRKKDGKLIIENVPIRMRVVYVGHRVDFTTGYRVDVAKWDSDKQRVKNGCINKLKESASDINSDLDKCSAYMQAVFKEYEIKGVIPTPKQIKNSFNNKLKNKSSDFCTEKLLNLFDEYMKECSVQNNWAENTIKKLVSIKNHLKDFDENLTLDSLTLDLLGEFVSHLQDKDLRNSTIKKLIARLKTFLRWGIEKNYTNNNAFESFNPRLKTAAKRVVFLSWDEVMQLKEYQIPETKKYLERVRDVFLFQCFTGLRHSDVYNLKRSDIKDNHIDIVTVKTADSLIIELNTHSRKILDKYKSYHFENDKVFPVVSNQKMNDYLKELGELAGLNEPVRETYYKGSRRIDEVIPKYSLLATHAGRRTFVCNSLAMGIPAETVMKWTGHNDYRAMKPYIDIADRDRLQAMQIWDKKEVQKTDNLLDQLKQLPKENLISLFTGLLS